MPIHGNAVCLHVVNICFLIVQELKLILHIDSLLDDTKPAFRTKFKKYSHYSNIVHKMYTRTRIHLDTCF